MKKITLVYLLIFLLVQNMVSCKNRTIRIPDVAINEKSGIAFTSQTIKNPEFIYSYGAIVRGDTSKKMIALVFTGDEFGDGGEFISKELEKVKIHASFFLTGNFYRNKSFRPVIQKLIDNGNYFGSHSDRHLLYCDWVKRDSLLVNKTEFINDLDSSYLEMTKFGIRRPETIYFLPPYEWYNDSIAAWTKESGLQLINFTSGTRSNADYTYPGMGNQYVDSETIYNSILNYEQKSSSGMNGFILLLHIGTDRRRTDKMYLLLPGLIKDLKKHGYRFVRIDELLNN